MAKTSSLGWRMDVSREYFSVFFVGFWCGSGDNGYLVLILLTKRPHTASLDHTTPTMLKTPKLSSNTTLYHSTLPVTNVQNVLVMHQQINLKCWSWEQRTLNGAARPPKHAWTLLWSDMQEPPVLQHSSKTTNLDVLHGQMLFKYKREQSRHSVKLNVSL